jgi:hypothetical protein
VSRGGTQRDDERAYPLAASPGSTLSRPPSSPPRHRSYPELPSSNYWRFNNPAAINRDPIPSSIFAIPDECDAMCQTTHLTYAERLQMRADLEMKKQRA